MSAEQTVLIVAEEVRGTAKPAVGAGPADSAAPSPPRKPRLKRVDRQQMVWRALAVERLIEPDHPARAIWALLGTLNLEKFCAGIKAVEGRPGRDHSDPRVVIAL